MGILVFNHANNYNNMYILLIFIIVFYTIGYLNENQENNSKQ